LGDQVLLTYYKKLSWEGKNGKNGKSAETFALQTGFTSCSDTITRITQKLK